MKLTRGQTWAALVLVALLFGFTLLNASWLATAPTGKPRLIADHALEPVRDTAGCIAEANSGYGTTSFGPDVGALQAAVGMSADGIRVRVEDVGGALMVERQYKSTCPADTDHPQANVLQAASGLTKPVIFWQVKNASDAKTLIGTLPLPTPNAPDRNAYIGDDGAVKAILSAQPKAWAFSIASARQCASDYRTSGMLGSVPAVCQNGTMLLTLDDLGFTLWGWPNRFLERMKTANTKVIIAEAVDGETIKGLTDIHQYGDIASSYNGYIWVDKIEDLGPALKR